MIRHICRLWKYFNTVIDCCAPIADLLARCWIAKIFFVAGLTKIQTWDSTLMLFTYEYHVPIISPEWAAVLGTLGELVLPVLLVLGLGGRATILIFFIYNFVCVWSYPLLWTPQGHAGLEQHINWGLLLALLMTHGYGKISLDYLICKIYGRWNNKRAA